MIFRSPSAFQPAKISGEIACLAQFPTQGRLEGRPFIHAEGKHSKKRIASCESTFRCQDDSNIKFQIQLRGGSPKRGTRGKTSEEEIISFLRFRYQGSRDAINLTFVCSSIAFDCRSTTYNHSIRLQYFNFILKGKRLSLFLRSTKCARILPETLEIHDEPWTTTSQQSRTLLVQCVIYSSSSSNSAVLYGKLWNIRRRLCLASNGSISTMQVVD